MTSPPNLPGELLGAALDALPAEVVVVDAQGIVLLANQAWNRFAAHAGASAAGVSPGVNYLDVCRRASAAGDAGAAVVLDALQQVLDGRLTQCEMEYACTGPQGEGWYLMHARPLPSGASAASGGLVISHLDITARKRSVDRLRGSEARYRQLLEEIEQGFCILQVLRDDVGRPVNYRFLEVNSTFERHTGIANAVGQTVGELVPDIEQHWIDIYGRVARTGVSERIELASAALGRVFEVEAVAVGDPGSDKVALLFSDTTERRRAAADLGFLTGLSTAFAQSSSVDRLCRQALLRVTRHFGVTRACLCDVDNAAGVLSIFAGHRGDDGAAGTAARPLLDHLSPRLVGELRSGLTVCVDDLSKDDRTAGRQPLLATEDMGAMVFAPSLSNGQLAFLLVLAAPGPRRWRADECTLAGELAGRIHACIERARAESAVRESEARLRLAARTASFGVHDHDLRRDNAVWSEELYAIAGLEAGDRVDLAAIEALVHPADRAAVAQAYQRALDPAGDGEFTLEFRIVRRHTGETRWVAMRSRTLFADIGGDRHPARNTGVVIDITERKRAEEHLREDARRKDEFLAMLAHELRNPLAPIRSAVEVLGATRPDAPMMARCRDVIDRQVSQMVRLLDDLLELTRLARGRVNLRREVVTLGEVLDLAIETARPTIEQHHHQLDLVTEAQPLRLLADKSRLTQVFANLLNNAAKYSHDGGRIRLTVSSVPGAAEVSVSDEGIGIAPEMLDSVFELFVQASQARAHAPGGLGIGLSLAKRLVDMHGGSIRVHSDGPGRGSEFTVRLPLHHVDAPAERQGTTGTLHVSLDARVLVVDDNVDAADTLAMLLGALGCQVRVAYDGPAALTVAEAFAPDVVLLDLGMPGLDGYEVCRRLRAQPGGMDRVIAAVSGWGQEQDRRHSALAGFDHHCIKPLSADALVNLLQR